AGDRRVGDRRRRADAAAARPDAADPRRARAGWRGRGRRGVSKTSEPHFHPEGLTMLRQLFPAEAHDALAQGTARVLAAGAGKATADALTEMMRVTHTLKGAAGTVGLDGVVDLSHRLESALAALGRDEVAWTAATADAIVEITDAMRGYLDHVAEPGAEN